jgi:hypothetical protein
MAFDEDSNGAMREALHAMIRLILAKTALSSE